MRTWTGDFVCGQGSGKGAFSGEVSWATTWASRNRASEASLRLLSAFLLPAAGACVCVYMCVCVCVCVYDVCVNLAVRFIWHHGLQYPPSPSHVLFYDSWSYVVFMLLLSICHLFYKVLTSNFLGRNYHSLWEVAATVPFLQPLNPPLSPFNLLLDWCSNEAISIFDPQACLCLIFPLDFLQG